MRPEDPFDLDSTNFADYVSRRDDEDLPEVPPHPLTATLHVTELCEHLRERTNALSQLRNPNGEMRDDAYFEFNEGLMVRPEVIAMFCFEYFKAHPEILSA